MQKKNYLLFILERISIWVVKLTIISKGLICNRLCINVSNNT